MNIRKSPILGILLMFVLGCASTPEKLTTSEEYISRGNTYAEKKEYDSAIADYTRAINIDPLCIEAYINRGDSYYNKKAYNKAVDNYTQATRIDAKYWDAYIRIGYVYMENKDYENAYKLFIGVLNNVPDYGKALLALGNMYTNMGQYDQAVLAFNYAIGLEPDNAGFIASLGTTYLRMGRTDQAVEELERALSIHSSNPAMSQCYFYLSSVYANIGEYDLAFSRIREGIVNFPEQADSLYYALALLYVSTNTDSTLFIEELIQIINQNKYAPEIIYASLFALYSAKQNIDEAITEFTEGIIKFPNNKYLYIYRGMLYREKDDSAKTIQDINKAISIDRNFAEAYAFRALLVKDHKKAISDLNKAISLKPDFIQAYHARAKEYLNKGNSKKAEEDFVKIESLNPEYNYRTDNIFINFINF